MNFTVFTDVIQILFPNKNDIKFILIRKQQRLPATVRKYSHSTAEKNKQTNKTGVYFVEKLPEKNESGGVIATTTN